MRILADENIPYVADAFGHFGEVRAAPASALTRDALIDVSAEALLVRSVTRVDADLVEGTRLRFVATATIGTDHIDQGALKSAGIGFAAAPGSNAVSVAEWVVAALLAWTGRRGGVLAGKTLGVVGAGQVGARVTPRARALGMNVLWCDPPRARAQAQGTENPASGDPPFLELSAMLPRCDFVSLHVPLTPDGPDRTLDMAGDEFFSRLPHGAVFLNASRGKVVDEAALGRALASGRVAGAALDVWRGEPAISPETLRAAYVATPHVAGYSFDGKVAGTAMIHAAACRFFGVEDGWDFARLLPAPSVPRLAWPPDDDPLDAHNAHLSPERLEGFVRRAVEQVYPIMADDRALRSALDMPPDEAALLFTRLRKEYPPRREFRFTRANAANAPLEDVLAGIGFFRG